MVGTRGWALTMAFSALLGATVALTPTAAQQASSDAAERARPLDLQRTTVTRLQQAARVDIPTDQTVGRAPRRQPQSRHPGRAGRIRVSTRRCEASFGSAASDTSRRWSDYAWKIWRGTIRNASQGQFRPCSRSSTESRAQLERRRRARPRLPGQLQPDEAQGARLRRPRVGDGSRAGERAVAGTTARPCRSASRTARGLPRARCSRRTDEGSHPRVGVRRRRARSTTTATDCLDIYLVTGAELTPSRERVPHRNVALSQPRRMEVRGRLERRPASISPRGAAACAPAISTATAASISTSPTGGPTRCSATSGDGTFEEVAARAGVAAGGWSTGCTFFDADGDGDLDLYVARYVDDDLGFGRARAQRALSWRERPAHHGRPGRTARRVRICSSRTSATDSFVEADRGARPRRRRDAPTASASSPPTTTTTASSICSSPTIRTRTSCYHNLGNGRFESVGLDAGVGVNGEARAQAGMGADAGDYDGDGRLDLVLTDVRARPIHALSQRRRPPLRGRDDAGRHRRAHVRAAWAGARRSSTPTSTASSICSSPTATSSRTSTSSRSSARPTGRRTSCCSTWARRFRDVSERAGRGLQIARGRPRPRRRRSRQRRRSRRRGRATWTTRRRCWRTASRTRHHWVAVRAIGRDRQPVRDRREGHGQTPAARSRSARSGRAAAILSQSDLRAYFGLGRLRRPGRRRGPHAGRRSGWEWKQLPTDRLHVVTLSESTKK